MSCAKAMSLARWTSETVVHSSPPDGTKAPLVVLDARLAIGRAGLVELHSHTVWELYGHWCCAAARRPIRHATPTVDTREQGDSFMDSSAGGPALYTQRQRKGYSTSKRGSTSNRMCRDMDRPSRRIECLMPLPFLLRRLGSRCRVISRWSRGALVESERPSLVEWCARARAS